VRQRTWCKSTRRSIDVCSATFRLSANSTMQRSHPPHIPTEIMRTVVAISETGSLSKAAGRLNLSQPALSAQIKRLQVLVGGEIFARTANGTAVTELGRLVVEQARRMLDANDQLFFLGGNRGGQGPIRVGLSTLFVGRFFEGRTSSSLQDVFVFADHSSAIRKGLSEGFIDVGCLLETRPERRDLDYAVVSEVEWQLQWIRTRDFVLSPGSPIPIVTLPEDDWMIRPLADNGLSFRIVFHSPDVHSRLCAVRSGIGLSAMPAHMVPPDLVKAREFYLPLLPAAKAAICVRRGIERERVSQVLQQLELLCTTKSLVAAL
jgi:DNA-binding transcriptional LysR family regulator